MKRNICFLGLLILIASFIHGAEIKVTKSKFVDGTDTSGPKTALNTKTGETLVVYTRVSSVEVKTVARMTDRNGKAIRSEITLESHPAVDAGPFSQNVAYNPVTNEFLWVFAQNENNDPALIFAQRLSSRGKPKGSPVNIITEPDTASRGNVLPRVVFNPNTGGYTIIWVRGESELVGMLLTNEGRPGGPIVILPKVPSGSPIPIPDDLKYLPSGNKLLLLYRVGSSRGPGVDFFLATLDPLLSKVKKSDFEIVNKNPVEGSAVARLAFPSERAGMVFYVDNTKVLARKIDLQGKVSGPSIAAFKAPLNKTQLIDLTVAFSSTAQGTRGVLIAKEEERAVPKEIPFYAQVLDENAKALGTPVQIHSGALDDFIYNGTVSNLPQKPADKDFRFVWFGTLDRVEGAGILKLKMNLKP